jgi:hypothetical protein
VQIVQRLARRRERAAVLDAAQVTMEFERH